MAGVPPNISPARENRDPTASGGFQPSRRDDFGLTLPLGHYRAVFCALDRVRFSDYSGSTWRGAFGHALRAIACSTGAPQCAGCPHLAACAYAGIFETGPSPSTDRMRLYNEVPRPFVLRASESAEYAAGSLTELQFVLIGRANDHLALIISALSRAGRHGLTDRRARLELIAVDQQTDSGWLAVQRADTPLHAFPLKPQVPPPCPTDAVTLAFETPLRLIRDGRLVTAQSFRFDALFSTLIRRISMLGYFHAALELELDFAGLVDAARKINPLHAELHWREWQRHSNRQRRAVDMSGLQGRVVFNGPDLAPFWPFLWLGQWTHVGKGAVMGLGRYSIQAASLRNQTDVRHPPKVASARPAPKEASEARTVQDGMDAAALHIQKSRQRNRK